MIGIENPFLGVKRYLTPIRMGEIRAAGVNQVRFWRRESDGVSREYASCGVDFDYPITDLRIGADKFPKEFGEPYARTKDKRYLCRKPCLNDERYVEGNMAEIAGKIRQFNRFSPTSYDCGDENTLTLWATPFDFCFGEHTLAAFREWLKTQYASLDELNEKWGTNFAEWSAVMPDTTEESRDRAKANGRRAYGAWADHRRFMELTFCGHVDRVKAVIDRESPGLPLDMSGTQPPNGWTGMDMYLLSKSIGIAAAYDHDQQAEIIRSFGRPQLKPWYGYGGSGVGIRYRIWHDAFRFLNYGAAFFSEENILMPDYSTPEQVLEMKRAFADLQAGGARLLRSLETDVEVLVHYSQASIHAAQIEKDYVAFIAAREKLVARLNATGVPYRFVAYGEIEQGELDRTSAKALILPRSKALSTREVEGIRRFVARGGKVVGDEVSGIMDEHCRYLGKSAVADLLCKDYKLGDDPKDGIRSFRWRSRRGLQGTYFGFVRSPDAKGSAAREARLEKPAYVYDLRKHRLLGRVESFRAELPPIEAAFYAALPYEIKGLELVAPESVAAGEKVEIRFEIAATDKIDALHPVRFEVITADGAVSDLYSGVAETVDGRGCYSFRTAFNDKPGKWRVQATDFISGKKATISLKVD